MRIALMLAALGLASSTAAQMPLPPFGSTFTGALTRGFWFQAPTTFVIIGLAVPNESGQPFQAVEVLNFGATPPPAFPTLASGTQLFYDNSTAGGSIIPTAIVINAGDYIGILGACTPAVGSATSSNSYANVAGAFVSDILGIPTTLTRFGTQFGIGAGGNNPCWSEPGGTFCRVEVYVSGAAGTVATNTNLGQGCVSAYDSFYQAFATAAPAATALTGNVLNLAPTANGYQGTWIPGGAASLYVAPTGGTTLATGDDGEVTYTLVGGPLPTPYGAQTALRVSGNAIIGWGAGALTYPGTNSFTPTPAGFLNATSGGVYAWHDYNAGEAGSGPIVAEEISGTLYITWNGVESYSNPVAANPSTLQFQFDLSSGAINVVFVSIDGDTTSTFGSGHLIGVTAPGASNNVPAIDLATATPAQLLTVSPELLPLGLTASTRPILGTNWNLQVQNIPATTVFGVNLFGTADPGITDLFFLGMPGCQLRSTLDLIQGPWVPGGSTFNYSFPIPATPPSLVGFELFTQAATFSSPPVNAFGAITSNGIKGTLGDI